MKKVLLASFALVAALVMPGCATITRDGEYNGYVTAVERNGLIWPTWTAYVKTENESSQENTVCIGDDALVASMKLASKNRERVSVFYHDELIVAPWRCNSEDAIADSMK